MELLEELRKGFGSCGAFKTSNALISVSVNIPLTLFPDLLESMRQAELCDWALDPALFTSLCDSLNRFFTQKGMITSGNNSPLALGAPHPLQAPPFNSNPPPTLANLTHPSPLPYNPTLTPVNGAPPSRRALPMQGPGFQRPQLTQPANTHGETWKSFNQEVALFWPVYCNLMQEEKSLPVQVRLLVPTLITPTKWRHTFL